MSVRLEPRGDRAPPLVFKQGAHAPYAIRWYGATSLVGHFRNFIATAIASESVDSRDWMRPLDARELLANVTRTLGLAPRDGDASGAPGGAPTLMEAKGGPLWIDWIADTGDDRDVSQAVGRMLFAEYTVDEGGETLLLPRGDVLLFGGDTAYPVATADEIYRRVVQPWNEVLDELPPEPRRHSRVLLGIPGNHDWYDGLDGFGRMFRRRARSADRDRVDSPSPDAPRRRRRGRKVGLVARGLHLDEVGGTLRLIADAAKAIRAFWRGTKVTRRRRLTLEGYEAVQESSYWALPVAPGLDLWGVDRQLGRLDYRQREYFRERRREVGEGARLWFAAADPAIAFGEKWEIGQRMLAGCRVSLEHDRVLYLCGDMHHYERRAVGESLHVIAGGGGAFLHGTVIPPPSRKRRRAERAYPDAATSRALVVQMPLKVLLGRAGYLVHIGAALVASIELGAGWGHSGRLEASSLLVSAGITWALYAIAGHQRAHPRRVLAVAIPFGLALGLLPMMLATALFYVHVPLLERDTFVTIVYAFVGAFLFTLFLTICAVTGLESQQAFTALGHPGFKHFVRLRVSPDGTVDAWVIGKDDPLASGPGAGPWLIDRWTWPARRP
jgi:hypothetical protein